ncbi:MAG: hypothetical protein V4529_16435 [Gemmatimonadota bacterium]
MKAPALVLAIPHKGGGDDEGDDEDMADGEDSDAMEACDAFCDAADIPEDKRKATYDALRAFVKCCC